MLGVVGAELERFVLLGDDRDKGKAWVVDAKEAFVHTVLGLLVVEQVPPHVRQAAAIFFKNLTKRHWDAEEPTSATIPDATKQQAWRLEAMRVPEAVRDPEAANLPVLAGAWWFAAALPLRSREDPSAVE